VSLLCGHSAPFSATWPTSGTTRRGTAYPLPLSAHPTSGGESSSSPGLPTPTARLGDEHSRGWPSRETARRRTMDEGRRNLEDSLALLPTPPTSEMKGPHPDDRGTAYGANLRTTIATLPTPTARDHKGRNQRDDETCPTGALLPTTRATDGTKGGPNQRGSSGDLMLPSAVVQLLPTPTATPYGTNQSPSPGAAVRPSLDQLIPQLLPTPTAMDSNASGGSTASDVTLTDAVVRTGMGTALNPRHGDRTARPSPAGRLF
jgi:hypothetical protein